MNVLLNNMTVADYCAAYDRKEIKVNPDYQRSDRVWPTAARSYLVETIVLRLPLPKIYLHQVTDVKSRKTYKEIVDGQQRTKAIRSFYHDEFALARNLETESIRGKRYSELDHEHQAAFLDFSLSIDLFVGASQEDIRETFRRMNSYTIPLNPEEHRHASHQGEFKWFIAKIARELGDAFLALGIFKEKPLVRMADTKLLAEICHALLHGIRTTKKTELDKLYKEYDRSFEQSARIGPDLVEALDRIIAIEEVHRTPLMKPHIVYALWLALIHTSHRIEPLMEAFPVEEGQALLNEDALLENLLALVEALNSPEEAGELASFVKSCSGRTNVKEQRVSRFQWMCRAMTESIAWG